MQQFHGGSGILGSWRSLTDVERYIRWIRFMHIYLSQLKSYAFKKGSCQFLAKERAQYWLTA